MLAGLLTVSLIALVVLLFGARLLDLLYGHQFGQFAPIAVIVSIGWCGASLGLGAILSLKATRRTHLLFGVSLMSLVASVVATAVLVPLFGLDGAAFAVVVTYGVATTAQLVAHHRHSRRAAEAMYAAPDLAKEPGTERTPEEIGPRSRDRPGRRSRAPAVAPVPGMLPQVEVEVP